MKNIIVDLETDILDPAIRLHIKNKKYENMKFRYTFKDNTVDEGNFEITTSLPVDHSNDNWKAYGEYYNMLLITISYKRNKNKYDYKILVIRDMVDTQKSIDAITKEINSIQNIDPVIVNIEPVVKVKKNWWNWS